MCTLKKSYLNSNICIPCEIKNEDFAMNILIKIINKYFAFIAITKCLWAKF